MTDESIKFPATYDNNLAPSLNYNLVRPRVKSDGQCLKQGKAKRTHKKVVTIYNVYETSLLPYIQGTDFRLKKSLFDDVKLVKEC